MPRQSLASPLKFSLVLTGFMLVFAAFWLQQTQQSVLAQDDGTAVPLLLNHPHWLHPAQPLRQQATRNARQTPFQIIERVRPRQQFANDEQCPPMTNNFDNLGNGTISLPTSRISVFWHK